MKNFPILGGKAYVVVLPEGAKFPRIETNQSIIPYGQDLCWDRNGGEKSYGMDETEWVGLPQGNWRIVSTLADLTEDKALDLVDWYHVSDNMDLTATYAFKDYANGEDNAEDYWDEYMMDTALESFHSAIVASGYSLENPYDSEPVLKKLPSELAEHLKRHGEAQSRTLNPELTLILERK